MSKKQCGKCGNKGHNARTCTTTKDREFNIAMVEIINESMEARAAINPTLVINKEGQVFLEESPEISGLLALSVCRMYLNLPNRNCPGPPPGTLGAC